MKYGLVVVSSNKINDWAFFSALYQSQRQIIVGHTPIQTLGCSPNDGIWESKLRLKDGRSSVVCIDGGVALPDSDSALIAYNLLDYTIRILPKIEQDYFSVNSS